MKMSDAILFLEFIRGRQKTSPNDVFAFQFRISRGGELEDPIDTSDDSDDDASVPRVKKQLPRGRKVPTKSRPPKATVASDAEDTDSEDTSAEDTHANGGKDSQGGRHVDGAQRPQLGKGKGKEVRRPETSEEIRPVKRNIPLPGKISCHTIHI